MDDDLELDEELMLEGLTDEPFGAPFGGFADSGPGPTVRAAQDAADEQIASEDAGIGIAEDEALFLYELDSEPDREADRRFQKRRDRGDMYPPTLQPGYVTDDGVASHAPTPNVADQGVVDMMSEQSRRMHEGSEFVGGRDFGQHVISSDAAGFADPLNLLAGALRAAGETEALAELERRKQELGAQYTGAQVISEILMTPAILKGMSAVPKLRPVAQAAMSPDVKSQALVGTLEGAVQAAAGGGDPLAGAALGGAGGAAGAGLVGAGRGRVAKHRANVARNAAVDKMLDGDRVVRGSGPVVPTHRRAAPTAPTTGYGPGQVRPPDPLAEMDAFPPGSRGDLMGVQIAKPSPAPVVDRPPIFQPRDRFTPSQGLLESLSPYPADVQTGVITYNVTRSAHGQEAADAVWEKLSQETKDAVLAIENGEAFVPKRISVGDPSVNPRGPTALDEGLDEASRAQQEIADAIESELAGPPSGPPTNPGRVRRFSGIPFDPDDPLSRDIAGPPPPDDPRGLLAERPQSPPNMQLGPMPPGAAPPPDDPMGLLAGRPSDPPNMQLGPMPPPAPPTVRQLRAEMYPLERGFAAGAREVAVNVGDSMGWLEGEGAADAVAQAAVANPSQNAEQTALSLGPILPALRGIVGHDSQLYRDAVQVALGATDARETARVNMLLRHVPGLNWGAVEASRRDDE